MVKYFAILILCFCAMPTSGFAEYTSQKQSCPENYYNHWTWSMFEGNGYECLPCDDVHAHDIHFNYSDGGEITVNDCYEKSVYTVSGDDLLCKLFYDGRSFCTLFNNTSVNKPWHLEKVYLSNGGWETNIVSNTKNCSDFDLDNGGNLGILLNDYAGTQGIVAWGKNLQQGTAIWNANSWDVADNCRLAQTVTGIKRGNTSTNCNGFIFRMGAETVGNAFDGFSIKYTGEDLYACSYCGPGKMPEIFPLNNNQYYACEFYNIGVAGNGTHKACMCEDVEFGYYSTGCDLPEYPLTTDTIPASCHNSCPAGTTTDDEGATSIDQCSPDGSTEYCDSIGCFTLSGTCTN